jgi:hypothetical protein
MILLRFRLADVELARLAVMVGESLGTDAQLLSLFLRGVGTKALFGPEIETAVQPPRTEISKNHNNCQRIRFFDPLQRWRKLTHLLAFSWSQDALDWL